MPVDGVSSYLNVDPNALGFEFSGEEPDGFTLMTQTVPVQAGKAYALAVDYRSSGIAPGSGLSWAVSDERTGAVLARTASLASEQKGSRGGRLTLVSSPRMGPDLSACRSTTSGSRARYGWRESLR